MRRASLPNDGFTLVELLVVSAIVATGFVFLFSMVRNFGTGVTSIQRVVPMQRDLQMAKQVIEKDLLSATRGSIGNAVPNPGFEFGPIKVSTFTPPPAGYWGCPPFRTRMNPFRFARGYVTSQSTHSLNGNYGLTLNVQGGGAPIFSYAAESSKFTLVPGTPYLFGGWFYENQPADLNSWRLRLHKGSLLPYPVVLSKTLTPWLSRWEFYASTFVATNDYYRVMVAAVGVDHQKLVGSFDDITVTPLVSDLAPGGCSFEFDQIRVAPPQQGQRDRILYRLVSDGLSGRLVRQRTSPTGEVEILSPIPHIRRLVVGWDFGQGNPGDLPPSGQWSTLFKKGMNFPLIVRIETGNVGATGSQTLALTFSVFPETP